MVESARAMGDSDVCRPHAVFFEAGASILFGFLPALLCVFSAKVLAASFSFWIGRFVFKSSSTATAWAHRNKYFIYSREEWSAMVRSLFFLQVIGCLPMILQNASAGNLAGMAVALFAGKSKTQVWGYVFPVLGVLSSVLITVRIKKCSAGITEASSDASPCTLTASSSSLASPKTSNTSYGTDGSKKSE